MEDCLFVCLTTFSVLTNYKWIRLKLKFQLKVLSYSLANYQNLIPKHCILLAKEEWERHVFISQPVSIPVPPTFPNPSLTVTSHHSQWFLWVKRSKGESHWFFCIIASHSQLLFQWVAVSETTRALMFVVLCSDCFCLGEIKTSDSHLSAFFADESGAVSCR